MANKLANEKSPYLLQHANNPVDWYPWGEEAFEKAVKEEKPVFLSIGYSTCHWCHVMERESFEDKEVAQILNDGFVSIKVDREERPDIDHIYMNVCHALTGQGGWPLTVLMTPEKKPFFAGTYFPKSEKWGRPGLVEILTRVRETWSDDRGKLAEAGEQITETARRFGVYSGGKIDKEVLHRAYRQFRSQFDQKYGGFGASPKFPTPHNLTFLLRYWKRSGKEEALAMVEKTLVSMYRGGIYDHVGYGFSRYSTDEKWLVPHFEKMLYDNALLALAYIEAFQATGRDLYARVAKEIFTYILRDMTSKEGGFYSAEDADSEGVEGKFYVWTPGEVKEILGEQDGDLYCRLFDITDQGNFEGHNIPNLIKTGIEWMQPGAGDESPDAQAGYAGETGFKEEALRQKLFDAREKRVHPYKDDKILTSWNGLMIAALARGSAVLGEPAYRHAAQRAADFIERKLTREDGRLLARYRDGEASFLGYVDDYAFFSWGLIELYGATFEAGYLKKAVNLARQSYDLFWDVEHGGFFFSGKDAEQLISRPKETYDGALPSGNSVMLHNLSRLARITWDNDLTDIAQRQAKTFAGAVGEQPRGFSHFLMGLDFLIGPSREIVIAGKAGEPDTEAMLKEATRRFLPDAVVVFHQEGEAGKELEEIAPYLAGQKTVEGMTTAYICRDYACQAPITDLGEYANNL